MESEATPISVRLRDDDRTATWNPALTRSTHVILVVHLSDGRIESRRSMNSGRARVREGERIAEVLAEA